MHLLSTHSSRTRSLAGSILISLMLLSTVWAAEPDSDPATTRLSKDGLFKVTINSQLQPIAINQIHSWIVHVEDPAGMPVEQASITVSGGMPAHNHGLPTVPQVTKELGQGDYLVEGIKFQMGGDWVMNFSIEAGAASDTVTFNLQL